MGSNYFLLLLLTLYLLAAVAVCVIYQVVEAVRHLLKFHGKMLVVCPETRNYAAVDVAAGRAAMASIVGRRHLQLSDCSRWPERADCPQDCLSQIEAGPANHRVWAIASQWYARQECAYCHKPIGEIHHLDRRPALLGPDRITTEWDELPAEKLPEAFSKRPAVCWSCHMAETFRRVYPHLVVDRNWKQPPPPA